MAKTVSIHVGASEYEVPEVFEDEVRLLAANLDWAAAFGRGCHEGDYFMAGGELRMAAKRARALADVCDEFAADAERMSARQMAAVA